MRRRNLGPQQLWGAGLGALLGGGFCHLPRGSRFRSWGQKELGAAFTTHQGNSTSPAKCSQVRCHGGGRAFAARGGDRRSGDLGTAPSGRAQLPCDAWGPPSPPAPSSPCLMLTTSGLHRSRAPHPRAPWFGVCKKCLAYGKNTIVMWVWGC